MIAIAVVRVVAWFASGSQHLRIATLEGES